MADEKTTKRSTKAQDLSGKRFGRWTVVRLAIGTYRHRHWQCTCDCGKAKIVCGSNLKSGASQSCGCFKAETTIDRSTKHGLAGTKEYAAWNDAFHRCYHPHNTGFKNYGGRGITMCERWRESVQAFIDDMGPCPYGMSLDRIDNDGNYEPRNCRWATSAQQSNNQRRNVLITHNGKTHNLKEWSILTGIPLSCLFSRFYSRVNMPLFAPSAGRGRSPLLNGLALEEIECMACRSTPCLDLSKANSSDE